jgi:hypothetical protein
MTEPTISKAILLAHLNDPMNETMVDVAKAMGIDIATLYYHKDCYRICRKNGVHISLEGL